MTTKDWRKVYKQLKVKPVIAKKYAKHNEPKKRTTGAALLHCTRCGRLRGHISKYGLHICRCCFREVALELGFKKYG